MRACIHRGTKEIGGSCIEIEDSGQRILLDLGLPLTAGSDADPAALLPPVEGLCEPAGDLLGLIISHPHQDHYGLASLARPDLPIAIGEAAGRILEIATHFTLSGLSPQNSLLLKDRTPFELGPFTVTPFLVDHSAYDAYAILVEAGGRRLLYSGDFRAHGRKASVFERLLRNPPAGIDALLMEGTTVSRSAAAKNYPTEVELEEAMTKLIRGTSGMVLLWTSGQNIDRLVTAFRATRRAGRQLIIDLYTAEILRATGNLRLPQGTWEGIRVFLPRGQRRVVKRHGLFDRVDRYRSNRLYPEDLAAAAKDSMMLFRPGLCPELEAAGCLDGAHVIYSLWAGYLRAPAQQGFLAWLDEHAIPLSHCHTSGHAAPADLARFAAAISPGYLVPIHTFSPGAFAPLYPTIRQKDDGVWWDV